MGILKLILIPVMLVTIVSGSYFVTVDGLKDAITMQIGHLQEILEDKASDIKESYRKASNWIEDKLNIGSYKLPNELQRLFFEINNEKFQQVKDEIDSIINVEEGGYDDITIKKMLLTYYSSICTRDTQILIYVTEEEFNEFDDNEGVFEKVTGDEIGGSKDDLYLSSFGIIELYKDGKVSEDSKMAYLPKEDLDKVKADAVSGMENAIEALSRCYTIDDIGKIKMYRTTKVTNKAGVMSGAQAENSEDKTTVTAEMVELDYTQYSSPYIIPVEFLADLLNLTGSPDFVDKFSRLQYDSYIRLGIYQTTLKEVTKTTTEYDLKTTIQGVRNTSFDGTKYLGDLQKTYPQNSIWQENPAKWFGYQCWAFVQWATESYYGSRADTATFLDSAGKGWTKVRNSSAIDTIKPGDTIRYHRSATNTVGHSAWVIAVNGDRLTLAEANWSGGNVVTWTRQVTKSQVKNDHFDYVIVAPYAIGEKEKEKEEQEKLATQNVTNQNTVGNNTQANNNPSAVGEKVEYSETQKANEVALIEKEDHNYQMEIVDIDTWYVKITRKDNKVISNTTYQTWNENQELVEIDKADEAIKIPQKDETKTINPIDSLEDGFEKNIIDGVIKNSKEKDCTWQTATLDKINVTKSKLLTTTASALDAGEREVSDNTDKFLALLKNSSGKYSRQDAKDGNYDPKGKVIPYDDIYKGKAYVGDLLKNGADMLFELLEDNLIGDEEGTSNTQGLVDVMKYIMWRYTGIDYGVTNFFTINFINNDLISVAGGDIIVKTDMQPQEQVLTKEQILNAAEKLYGKSSGRYVNINKIVDQLIQIQNTYKVNAVFAIAVTTQENGIGTDKSGILSKNPNNWFSIKKNDKEFKTYASPGECVLDFGRLIAGSTYFGAGKTTVVQISDPYCSPPENWANAVLGFVKEFYKAAGVEVNSAEDFLAVAKECHDYLSKNKFTYHQGNVVPYPNGSTYIDCSAYVTWVLYEYGYKELAGWQKSSYWFYVPENWEAYGWQKVEVGEAQLGDILVQNGHVEIYAGDGKVYSCGSTNSIQSSTPTYMDKGAKFAIRVTPAK